MEKHVIEFPPKTGDGNERKKIVVEGMSLSDVENALKKATAEGNTDCNYVFVLLHDIFLAENKTGSVRLLLEDGERRKCKSYTFK